MSNIVGLQVKPPKSKLSIFEFSPFLDHKLEIFSLSKPILFIFSHIFIYLFIFRSFVFTLSSFNSSKLQTSETHKVNLVVFICTIYPYVLSNNTTVKEYMYSEFNFFLTSKFFKISIDIDAITLH